MPAEVIVVHKFARIGDQGQNGVEVVDTTSKNPWEVDLSPFFLGPCQLYDDYVSQNVENAWQYSKVYEEHTENGEQTQEYWHWAQAGWNDNHPHRYPMGRGRAPLYSLWQSEHLGYIEARKRIYGPLYAEAVQRTDGWNQLRDLYNTQDRLYLRDWDGWSMEQHNMANLTDVLNNPNRKMGHAFVLKMLLENDPALEQMELR